MEKVVDTIQRNLPSQMSLNHWKVGPLQGDWEVNNDLKARGYSSGLSSESQYNLMDMDEQVRVATAAALAAQAMEHEREQRSSFAYQIHQHRRRSPQNHNYNHGNTSPRGRPLERQQQQMREVLQGIREKTPEYWKSVQEKTPEYLNKVVQTVREHGDKTPEYLNKVVQTVREHKVVQTVRERVFRPQDDGRLQYDCDAAGRHIATSEASHYVGSLNEDEELREQPPPPPSSFQLPDGSRIRKRCVQVINNVRELQGLKPIPLATAQTTNRTVDAEYYVNFHDGDAAAAIQGTMTSSSYQHTLGKAPIAQKHLCDASGYAEIGDEGEKVESQGDIPRMPSLAEQRVLERQNPQASSLKPFQWGVTDGMEQPKAEVPAPPPVANPSEAHGQSTASENEAKNQVGAETESQSTATSEATDPAEEEDASSEEDDKVGQPPIDLVPMHAAAKFQWGAQSSTTITFAQEDSQNHSNLQ